LLTRVSTPTDLSEIRRRRGELRLALLNLEESLAASPRGDDANWRLRIHGSLETLLADFREHVRLTEGPGGLHNDIVVNAPRLTGAVARLVREHGRITVQVGGLLAETAEPAAPIDPSVIRDSATNLIASMMKHRQAGADLIFEAYETDIGGSG
jgi:hypothetical protein